MSRPAIASDPYFHAKWKADFYKTFTRQISKQLGKLEGGSEKRRDAKMAAKMPEPLHYTQPPHLSLRQPGNPLVQRPSVILKPTATVAVAPAEG